MVIRLNYRCAFLALIFLDPIMSVSKENMSFQFSPADIVLSCTICQNTFSTIYADDDQDNGLRRDDEVPRNNRITKLWLTECAHLTCGRHLPGGGKLLLCRRHGF